MKFFELLQDRSAEVKRNLMELEKKLLQCRSAEHQNIRNLERY